MMKILKTTDGMQDVIGPQTLREIALEGARRMLKETLAEEVAAYIERHSGERDERGRALVVRNGTARERTIQSKPTIPTLERTTC